MKKGYCPPGDNDRKKPKVKKKKSGKKRPKTGY
jgi:hypothetical protein